MSRGGPRLSGEKSNSRRQLKAHIELQMSSQNLFADNTCSSPSVCAVNSPKILNTLVFPADKGAVVEGRLVATSVFVSFTEFIPDPL